MKNNVRFISILFFLMVFNFCYSQHLMTKEQLEELSNPLYDYKGNTATSNSATPIKVDSTDERKTKARKYLERIQIDTRKNDFSWISTQFTYPTCVEINCRDVQVNNPKELLKYKDQIFTPNIINAILSKDNDEMFQREDMYMIGNGEIWYAPGPASRIWV